MQELKAGRNTQFVGISHTLRSSSMASIREKPPPMLIPELGSSDKSFCRSCLVNNVGHLEILHHNISAPHVKKLRAQIRLRCYCMVCSVNLLNIKAAEDHVQDSRHERCMGHGFKAAKFADQTYKCPPCGIAFKCSIALELHLVISHKVTFSIDNLPDLTGVIKLLSGSSSDCLKVDKTLECLLCQVKCEAIDDFVLHLFSSVHIKSLRTSTCLVCEKEFIHVNDRENHLHAYKHKFQLQKVCLSNRLKKAKDMGQVGTMGYLCTYCMIWCKSWPCFMLHLLSSAHNLYAEIQDQRHMNKIVQNGLQEEGKEVEVIPDTPSPLISDQNWKKWLDWSAGISAWCLICEEMLLTPEALEKHLESCHGLQSISVKRKHRCLDSASEEGKTCNCFECEVCSVLFKNAFSLTVHKALPQHHIQQALVSNGGILCRCFDCRMRGRSRALEKTKLPKINSACFRDSDLEKNTASVENQCTKGCISKVNKENSDKSPYSDECQINTAECQINTENDSGKMKPGPGSHFSREPGSSFFKESSNSFQKEKRIMFEVDEEKGKMDSKKSETTGFNHNPVGPGYHHANKVSTPEEIAENDANLGTMEQHLDQPCDCQDKNISVYHESIQSANAAEMVPVVIAAALPASESIQNSLESAMKLVTESLSTAVPRIRKSLTEEFSSKKRQKDDSDDISADKHNSGNLRAILASAVCEGLKSFHSYSNLREASVLREKSKYNIKPVLNSPNLTCDRSNGLDLLPMSISMENVQGVSVVFAAAIIPQSSNADAISENQMPFSTGDRENPHDTAMEKTCGDQEIGGRKDPEQIDCVQNQKLSEQELTPHYNVVFEEDSSSDSDQQRVYMSEDDSDSSEDRY